MSFYPLTLEQANLKEVQGWKVGQQCQVKEWRGIYEIEGYHQYGKDKEFTTVYLAKLKKDRTKSNKGGDTRIENLMPLGAAQPTTDKNGLTAAEYAKQIFKSGFGKQGWYNTDRESLVKVLTITKTGRVKIQHINVKKGITPRSKMVEGRKIYSQEDSLVNLASLEYDIRNCEESTFSPSLYNGEWRFWHGGQTLEAPSMKLTWLLD
ncbi:MAG: hypothetical protein Q8911_00430 [Bacillota bacterium]|nr:hypothetical protein [Bacillota bacterium]